MTTLSPYRYRLTRRWMPGDRQLNWIMLNPSIGTETQDDPTLRRCIGYAKGFGYTNFVVTNLMAVRSTDPKKLATFEDPIGPYNLSHLGREMTYAETVVFAWGANAKRFPAAEAMALRLARELHVEPYCLGLTTGGYPFHPLYQPADAQLIPYPIGDSQ